MGDCGKGHDGFKVVASGENFFSISLNHPSLIERLPTIDR